MQLAILGKLQLPKFVNEFSFKISLEIPFRKKIKFLFKLSL